MELMDWLVDGCKETGTMREGVEGRKWTGQADLALTLAGRGWKVDGGGWEGGTVGLEAGNSPGGMENKEGIRNETHVDNGWLINWRSRGGNGVPSNQQTVYHTHLAAAGVTVGPLFGCVAAAREPVAQLAVDAHRDDHHRHDSAQR